MHDSFHQAAEVMRLLANEASAFQHPRPQGRTPQDIAAEIDPGYRLIHSAVGKPLNWTLDNIQHNWTFSMPNQAPRVGNIFEDFKGNIWIDVSELRPGVDTGHKIYAIAAGYAHNNDKVFTGDPMGLSPVALFRRLENMISSAVKFGTTRHLLPHEAQQQPYSYYCSMYPEFAEQIQGVQLNWQDGDDRHNLAAMLENSWQYALRYVPEMNEVIYDIDNECFIDSGSHERRAQAHFRQLSRRLRNERPAHYFAGSSTLARAAITNTLVRGAGTICRNEFLAALGDQLRGGRLTEALQRLFY
jgi:hypothetical protein